MTIKKVGALLRQPTSAVALAVGATVLLTVGVGTGFWVVRQRQTQAAPLPVGADMIPQDVWMTMTVTTDPNQWQELRQVGTSKTQTRLDEQLVQWRDRLLTPYGYDYQRDIQPWIGREATLAFLPPPSTTPTTNTVPDQVDPAPVLVLPIADITRAQRILGENQTSGTRVWKITTYKGIQVRETSVNQTSLVIGVMNSEELVVARDRLTVERVIDTYREGESLARMPGYRQNLDPINNNRPFLRLYFNAPRMQALAAANSIQAVPSWIFGFLQDNQGIAATVHLKADRIQIQGINWLPASGDRRYEVKNTATTLPSLLPEDTLLMVSSGNLASLWETFNRMPIANPTSLSNPANLRQGIQETTGLDVEQDLLAWMEGGAIALVPRTAPETGNQTVGVVLLSTATERTAADATFEQLDTLMRDRYRFQVKSATLQSQPIVTWTSPFGALAVTRGWLPGNTAFLTLGAPVAETLLPSPRLPLTQRDRFRAATTSTFKANNGQLFLDVERLTQANSSLPIPKLSPTLAPFAEAVQVVGLTTAIDSDRTIRYDINLLVPRTGTPRPFP